MLLTATPHFSAVRKKVICLEPADPSLHPQAVCQCLPRARGTPRPPAPRDPQRAAGGGSGRQVAAGSSPAQHQEPPALLLHPSDGWKEKKMQGSLVYCCYTELISLQSTSVFYGRRVRAVGMRNAKGQLLDSVL